MKWFLLVALLCGCAVVDEAPTPGRVFGATVADGAMAQDGALDVAEAAIDVLSVDVEDVDRADRSADVTTNDALDGATGSDADVLVEDGGDVVLADADDAVSDVLTPTDSGPDVLTADALDASVEPDVPVTADVVDVLLADSADAGDAGEDSPDVPVVVDAPIDIPVDMGPPPCPTGQTRCNGTCVDLQTDGTNCGACDTTCSIGAVCSGGRCESACSPFETRCSRSCVDTRANLSHCGACGNACAMPANATAVCAMSACGLGACSTGFRNCDGNAVNGCEINTQTDTNNCGACGTACGFANAGATCVAGACVLGACNAGFGNCDGNAANGCETDLRANADNCGACGNACPTFACAASACLPPLEPRLNLVWDPAETDVRGFSVQVADSVDGRAGGGGFVSSLAPGSTLCLRGSEAIVNGCRLNVRALTAPGSTALITAWGGYRWGFYARPLRADGSLICNPGDATCGGRWNRSTFVFRGFSQRCASPSARRPVPALDYLERIGTMTGVDYVLFLDMTSDSAIPATCSP